MKDKKLHRIAKKQFKTKHYTLPVPAHDLRLKAVLPG